MKLYAWTIFLSAFLLFQVQPMIGKFILPWFGSSPGVWTTCMLFFQLLLLAGYGYAHLLVSRLTPRMQAMIHVALLAAGAALLPITPSKGWQPSADQDPALRILLLLAATVGVPYGMLSSTGPLMQGWFARSYPGISPYRLYSLSNAGSLLALLSYPFAFEWMLRLSAQSWLWSVGYVAFAILSGCCAWQMLKRAEGEGTAEKSTTKSAAKAAKSAAAGPKPTWLDITLWLSLSACGSVLLVATTNEITLDVASVPFLWVVPLALYLLTFIICFDNERWYKRWFFIGILPLTLVGGTIAVFSGLDFKLDLSIPYPTWFSWGEEHWSKIPIVFEGLVAQITLYCAVLFFGCMACHGELARSKPAPQFVTLFYLLVSAGGALGGALVALVAPIVFNGIWEYHVALFMCGLLVLIVIGRELLRAGKEDTERHWKNWRIYGRWSSAAAGGLGLLLLGAVLMLHVRGWKFSKFQEVEEIAENIDPQPTSLDDEMAELKGKPRKKKDPRRSDYLWGGLIHLQETPDKPAEWRFFNRWRIRDNEKDVLDRDRNFYGVLFVERTEPNDPENAALRLVHGRINHGMQYTAPKYRELPTTYYSPTSGVGLAVNHHPQRHEKKGNLRIGVVGLGSGTLAAYGKQGDYVRFYDINPLVEKWADQHFRYLRDAKDRGADVAVYMGDARIVMERQLDNDLPERFDVLAIDAFSSDAIPMHLLTLEAMQIYMRHLKDDGILAVHISNRYLELGPVVRRLTHELNRREKELDDLVARRVNDNAETEPGSSTSTWVLVTRNEEFLTDGHLKAADGEWPDGYFWTDDFSSLFEALN